MVRGKVELKKIENPSSRQVTFCKRRNGVLKKAYELSVLCEVDVALIIFSQKGKLYEFSSSNMQKTIEKYHGHVKKDENCNPETEQKHKTTIIQQKAQQLEASQRMFPREELVSCSLEEISKLGDRLEHTLRIIRARKAHLYNEQIEKLKAKERCLLEENDRLCQENTRLCQKDSMKQKDMVACSENIQFSEVETDLCIGLRLTQNARAL